MSKINDLKKHISNISTLDEAEVGDEILIFFNKEFTDQDYTHLLRQERWKMGIYCPFCQSGNIQKQTTTENNLNKNNIFKYLCLDCNAIFEDDTGSPMSGSNTPLQIWIQCWYLSLYCNSVQYIADKLHLDVNIIINMLHGMRHLFQTEEINSQNKDSLEFINNNFNNKNINKKEEESFKKFLILGGDTGKQPLDTAEYRRQKNIKNQNSTNKKLSPKNTS